MASSSDIAINYLRFWYDASPVSRPGSPSFQDYSSWLDSVRAKSPSFLSNLGDALRTVRIDKVRKAYESLASRFDVIPPLDEFFNAVADQVTALNIENVSENVEAGVADSAKTLGKVALFGLSGYALVIGGLALVFLLPELKMLLKSRAHA